MPPVTISAATVKRKIPLPAICPASSGFPSPIFRPSCTVTPMASPLITMVMVCITWLPVDTADTSAATPNWPTTSRSTAPYMVWRKIASSTGRAKRSSGPNTGPWVKYPFFSIYPPCKKPDKHRANSRHLIRLCESVHKPSDE